MDSQKTILSIIIILIIVVILLGIIIVVGNKNKKIGGYRYTVIDEEKILVKTLEPVKIRNSFYAVQECTNKYFIYYTQIFNINEEYYSKSTQQEIEETEKQNIKVLYNMLDNEYIDEKEVTQDNLKSKLSEIGNCIVNITEMYVSEAENNIELYVVKGILKDRITQEIKDFQIIVKIDMVNTTFSVLPQEYIEEKYSDLTIGKEITVEILDNIEKNENNTFKYNSISDEIYVKDLFNKFKNQILNSKEVAYNKLDKEYSNKKFETFTEFKESIENNKERYSNMQVEEYQKNITDEYVQYVIIDKNRNYYIFNETAVMEYTVMLDTYTIGSLGFLNKYNSTNEQGKVALNIDKFFQALNAKDYNYAYNCLADSFKNNYFKTQQEFEAYVKANFYENNSVEYKSFETEGDLYTYSVIITNEQTKEQKSKTFIMQLGEGTEFVLSFNR